MENNTKLEIMAVSKQLFNERGYNNVSIKDIGDSLGISKGNITYHFKKKEDILIALISANIESHSFSQPQNMDELKVFFDNMQATVQENRFYFANYIDICDASDLLLDMRKNSLSKLENELFTIIKDFMDKGIIKHLTNEKISSLVDALLIANIYWPQYQQFNQTYKDKSFSEFAMNLLA